MRTVSDITVVSKPAWTDGADAALQVLGELILAVGRECKQRAFPAGSWIFLVLNDPEQTDL